MVSTKSRTLSRRLKHSGAGSACFARCPLPQAGEGATRLRQNDLHLDPTIRRQAIDQRLSLLGIAFHHRLDAAAADGGDLVGGHAGLHQVVAHGCGALVRQRDVAAALPMRSLWPMTWTISTDAAPARARRGRRVRCDLQR